MPDAGLTSQPAHLSPFDLPHRLAAKADPTLVAADVEHFALLDATLTSSIADLETRLDDVRRRPGGTGEEALERDLEVHRLTSRLRALRRYGLDLCLGRMVRAGAHDTTGPVYVGRFGLADATGRRVLVDWRSPAAEPFFAATHAHPAGLASRRRYRWTGGRITDYWDEVFAADPDSTAAQRAALDDQSAFVASLGASRSHRMRDVLATIQADQDAIIRSESRGTLVVDGGPGTGKTVVALHRAAYLLYADPRLGEGRGGVLFVGPHQPYLSYVADVLPSLGEDGVRTCTLRDLVPEGADAVEEADDVVARLKADPRMVAAVEPAVALYEEPPREGTEVETPWADVWLSPHDWAEAFTAAEPGVPHNEAREAVWDALLDILTDKVEVDPGERPALRTALGRSPALRDAIGGAWPLLEPHDLVGDLWSVPAYLRRCAPWLSPDEVRLLQRDTPDRWTDADLPLLDAARRRLGDPDLARRRRRQEADAVRQRAQIQDAADRILEAGVGDEYGLHMLRQGDLLDRLVDADAVPDGTADPLAGPFAHVVVDEAQELTDAEWSMLLGRCPSRSFTVVGDRAQARHRFAGSWTARLARLGLDARVATLTVNYRTPSEVMAEAEPVIRSVLPDANVPTSVRSSGVPVTHGALADLDDVVERWLAEHDDGTACVIGRASYAPPEAAGRRVRSLTPSTAKGLEFDLVVLVDPDGWEAVDRYVAMTRATRQLVVLGAAG